MSLANAIYATGLALNTKLAGSMSAGQSNRGFNLTSGG
jgi:hypothetical protein